LKDEETTAFLNVDLEVFSRESLAAFVKGLGRSVHVLHEGRWGRKYAACVELWASGWNQSPESIIRRILRLLSRMPRSARTLWNRADVRQFNIGVQAALKPRTFELSLSPESVAAIGRLKARIVFTVYAAESPPSVPPASGESSRRPSVERRSRTTRACS